MTRSCTLCSIAAVCLGQCTLSLGSVKGDHPIVLVPRSEATRIRTEDRYERVRPDADGIVRSRGFPGLWLDVEALLRGDRLALRGTVAHGVATPEHAAFAARLQRG